MEQQLKFAQLISQLSGKFVNLPATKVDEEMEHSLMLIANHLGIDRIALLQFENGTTKLHLTHTYASHQQHRAPIFLLSDWLPWYSGKLRRGETIRISKISDLPKDATLERQYMKEQGFKAFLTIPLKVEGATIGAISYSDMQRERDWSGELVKQLKAVTELFANTLARKRSEEALYEQLRFEKLITDLSATFVNLPADQINERINESLKLLSTTLNIDRIVLHEFSADRQHLRLCHYFAKPTIKLPTSTITSSSQPLFIKSISENKIIRVDRIEDLPPEAELERKYLVQQGVKSAISIPLRMSKEVMGVLTFASISRERFWPDDPVEQLKVLCEVFANALDRRDKEQELQKACSEIKELKDQLQQENIYLREEIKISRGDEKIVGQSESMLKVLVQAKQVAPSDSSVLIQGETGTGKEVLAQYIHSLSLRKYKPMIMVNCAALPATLIESELFGREKGAYTGALAKQIGRFEMAHGSTIFLDEISELPQDLQAKLLRVVQERQFERLGSSKTITVDVRIIATTNRDLVSLLKEGKFREDLYYRLNVFPITMPSLREHPEDIPLLVWVFVREFKKTMGKTVDSVPKKTMEALQTYSWPGNVRELKNIIERAMILSTNSVLKIDRQMTDTPIRMRDMTLEEFERKHILDVLERTRWRVRGTKGAAEILGLKPSTLESRMKKLGIERPS